MESEDKDLGQEIPLCHDSLKFRSVPNKSIKDVLLTSKLLDTKTTDLCKDMEKLVMHSVTKNTWSRHCSAWKLFDEFCNTYSLSNVLPIKIESIRAFATWAVSRKGLKESTVKAYISSLNVAHSLSNNRTCNLNSDPCIKMVLKGAKNLEGLLGEKSIVRMPMNIHLLEVLGHRVSSATWSEFSKQVFWTACLTSFFTSCRMREILPTHEKCFDPDTTVLWQNVQFLETGDILIFVPYSKTSGFEGKMLDLYTISDSKTSPTAALARLKKLAEKTDGFLQSNPVFALRSGKNLTKNIFNKKLAELLEDFCDENHKFTGHSFRAAIPTLIGSHPDVNSVSELKDWGNWGLNSYKVYVKDVHENSKKLFSKILNCMNKCDD